MLTHPKRGSWTIVLRFPSDYPPIALRQGVYTSRKTAITEFIVNLMMYVTHYGLPYGRGLVSQLRLAEGFYCDTL